MLIIKLINFDKGIWMSVALSGDARFCSDALIIRDLFSSGLRESGKRQGVAIGQRPLVCYEKFYS